MESTFKTIKGYPEYSIDTSGKVYSHYKKRLIKPHLSKSGYLTVLLYNNRIPKRLNLHRLVMITHNPHPNQKNLQVDHIYNDKTDCRLESLRWLTHSENIIASIMTGARKGKVTFAQAVEIKNAPANIKNKELAEKYGVNKPLIARIRRGATFKFIPTSPSFRPMYTTIQAAA